MYERTAFDLPTSWLWTIFTCLLSVIIPDMNSVTVLSQSLK